MTNNTNNILVRPCTTVGDVREFVEKHHYSHSIQGITPFLSFEIVAADDYQKRFGAAIFGLPGQKNTKLEYGEYPNNNSELAPKYIAVELRRLVMLDEAPQNIESKVLGILIQRLKHLGVDRIISYADPNQKRSEHPDGKHTGLIYKAAGFHLVKVAGRTSAFIVQQDFTIDGKTFKKGRRLPIRNWDQYQNFSVRAASDSEGLELLTEKEGIEWRRDWEEALRKGRAIFWRKRANGCIVFVIKTDKYLTSLSERVRLGVNAGMLLKEKEDGKWLWIKDLKAVMPYFGTPKKQGDSANEKGTRDDFGATEPANEGAKPIDEFDGWF